MSQKIEKAKKRMVFSFEFFEGARDGALASLSTGVFILVALKIVKQITK